MASQIFSKSGRCNQDVKEQFEPLVSDKSPVFIAGLSMGGYGAMRLGAKYPTLFSAFSGLSSITHFEQIGKFVSDFEGLKKTVLVQDGVLDWMLKNKAKLPPFRFDCGREDILIEYNRTLHKKLIMNDISHTYQEFAGGHSWDYWQKHLAKTLLFFNEKLS